MNKYIVFTLVAFFIGVVVGPKVRSFTISRTLNEYADRVYATCKDAGFAPSCYDQEIPKLMNRISMEEAFEVTKYIQQKDPRYLYCHVLAHKISYKETEKDITKWKDVVARCPATFCNNGCQHGALMRRFNAESLTAEQIEEVKPDLADVCEPRGSWRPTEVERSMCYHALGHLHMYITKANIQESADLCKTVGTKSDGRNYIQTCTEGVLMTIYQPLEPEDFALIKGIAPTKEKVQSFCSQFTGEIWEACRRESWPLFFDEIKQPEGLMAFCSYSGDPLAQKKCFNAVMNILTVQFVTENDNKLDILEKFCTRLPETQKIQCFTNAATRLIQIDPRYVDVAIQVCRLAQTFNVGEQCYNDVLSYSSYTFHESSPEYKNYCSKLDEPWRTRCFTREFKVFN